jgi:1-acyl-sn-glycerol-3-phosphate acyltransferase
MSATVVLPQEAPLSRLSSRIPAYKTIGYTLNISCRFLASSVVGRGSIARGDELLSWWAEKILRAGNAGLTAEGLENFVPGQPYVVMSNHRSLLDIPALFLAVPGSMRMVLKEELTRIPIWGRALVASGFVPVSRGNHARALAQLTEAKKHLSNGICVWIAPEGTRSRTGELGPFKKGGFHLARQLGMPIMPAWISGTDAIIPPDSFVAHSNKVAHVRFGTPIPTDGDPDDPIDELVREVRASFEDLARA